MTQITLDSTQAQILLQAHGLVRVCGPDGDLLGVIAPPIKDKAGSESGSGDFTDEDIEEAKRRRDAPGPRYTTKEVLEHLRALRPEVE